MESETYSFFVHRTNNSPLWRAPRGIEDERGTHSHHHLPCKHPKWHMVCHHSHNADLEARAAMQTLFFSVWDKPPAKITSNLFLLSWLLWLEKSKLNINEVIFFSHLLLASGIWEKATIFQADQDDYKVMARRPGYGLMGKCCLWKDEELRLDC